ncbi:MAG: RNA-binding protein [Puniceicoccaceae bacterium]|nr:MAG: RNA-binding protein [Puniceicoccaceae bacterium]
MNTKMYVGNLSYDTTEADIRDLFSKHGQVDDVALLTDRETGRPRGFGFVTMADKAGMEAAIKAINGLEVDGRPLKVNEARPRDERPSFGGGGGGGGGGGRGNRGGRGGRY